MSLGSVVSEATKSAGSAVGSAAQGASNGMGQKIAGGTPGSVQGGLNQPANANPNSSTLNSPLNDILTSAPKEQTLKPKMQESAPNSNSNITHLEGKGRLDPYDSRDLYDLEDNPYYQSSGPINYGDEDPFSNQPTQKTEGGKKVFEDENGREVKEGDKVEPGREVDENGQVKDSSTKKLTRVAGQAAAAYFTGGESLGNDQQIMNNRLVDHTIGVVADTAEKVPGVEKIADELDEAGVTDTVGDALNLAGDLKNGDIESVAENAEKIKDDVKKVKKYTTKKIMKVVLLAVIPLFFLILIIVSVIGPVIGGFVDLTNTIGETFENMGDFFDDIFSGLSPDIAMSEWVEGYENLSYEQQRIVAAAASLVGRPYQWGGKPTSAGLEGVPSTGLDCSGYVQWVLWTAYGVNPGYLSTSKISDLAKEGKRLKFVTAEELQPGDIGLKWLGYREGETNHTGIYAGDGYWFHAANSKAGIIRSKYTGFTVFYRYISDTPLVASGDYVNWRQMDSRWSGLYVGSSGKTLGRIGCLVTSIAILIEKSGVNRTIVPFNPGTFLQALNRNSGFTSGGSLYYDAVSKAVPNFKYVGKVDLKGKSKSEKLQIIKNYLDQGYYLAAEVKGATQNAQHWVAVMGVTSTGVSMVDPASNSTDMWSKYDWNKTSQFKYFKAG